MEASIRWATPEDALLPTYDNVKLQAVNTCPVWGVLRYQMHKRMPMGDGTGRALALECGSAMHDVFAWVRLCTLKLHSGHAAYDFHGRRVFGPERWEILQESIVAGDPVDQCKSGAIAILDTSGYYDDPRDKRRTLANMEECAYHYIDKWDWDHPVWQRDKADPSSDCGIEIPFDLVIRITTFDQSGHTSTGMQLFYDGPTKEVRFTGKIDGIHDHGRLGVRIHENKSSSRLSEAWHQSFHTTSQVTGYILAGRTFTRLPIRECVVLGLQVPLPKKYEFGGYLRDVFKRDDYHIERWLHWFAHSIDMYDKWRDNPIGAPQYTHSCNRYFRPCSMIPFCASSPDEQREMFNDMEHDEWSPLHERMASKMDQLDG